MGRSAVAALRRCAIVLAVAPAACHRRAAIESCNDDLRGVYRAGPEQLDERWMILDQDATLAAYPLFPDADGPADMVAAPRQIDLVRAGASAPAPAIASAALDGTLHRRYMRGAESCEARVAVHVTRCAGDSLELVLADPSPPLAFSPCRWPRASPSRLVRWQRE